MEVTFFKVFMRRALENVSLHLGGILKTLPTKKIHGRRLATNLTFEGGPKNVSYILVWSPLKSRRRIYIIYYVIYGTAQQPPLPPHGHGPVLRANT